MKYHIISINDDREQYKKVIRERVHLPQANVESFNAYEKDAVAYLEENGIRLRPDLWNPKVGEVGIWASTVNCWKWCIENNEDLVVFEDDAIPVEDFRSQFELFRSNLPDDYDFASLWVPENQRQDFLYYVDYDEFGGPRHLPKPPFLDRSVSMFDQGTYPVAVVYQGYGGVGLMFSPAGSKKFLKRAQEWGLWTTCDCNLYLVSHQAEVGMKSYAPHPDFEIVKYDWQAQTTVQHSERVL